jgi:hypothetical protein
MKDDVLAILDRYEFLVANFGGSGSGSGGGLTIEPNTGKGSICDGSSSGGQTCCADIARGGGGGRRGGGRS